MSALWRSNFESWKGVRSSRYLSTSNNFTQRDPIFLKEEEIPSIIPRPASAAYFTGNSAYYDLIHTLRHQMGPKLAIPSTHTEIIHTLQERTEDVAQFTRMIKNKESLSLSHGLHLKEDQFHSLVLHLMALHQVHPEHEVLKPFLNATAVAKAQARLKIPDENGSSFATGSRKTARAQVTLLPGSKGWFSVNGVELASYFLRREAESAIFPLQAAKVFGKYHVWAVVKGGGHSGQAEAIANGVAKALVIQDPELKPVFEDIGILYADTRQVERKKVGQKKARKKFTWVKR
jgi:small subunit ribosomal protein S9